MSGMIRSYKDLNVWQKSIKLAKDIHVRTEDFPKSELFGLTSQLRRAAYGIPANIAEGASRGHRKEYIQFLQIAYGSAAELETLLIIARDVDLLGGKKFSDLASQVDGIMRMLKAMIRSLKRRNER